MSVRKRVIKIMKDICVMQPDFPKINDICVRIIRRISDEEGIKVRHTLLHLERGCCTGLEREKGGRVG